MPELLDEDLLDELASGQAEAPEATQPPELSVPYQYVRPLADAAEDYLDMLLNDEGRWMFGIRPLDAMIRGTGRGELTFITGKAHSGKTQLARAVAQQLGWALVYKVINGLTELEELFWHYDAVDRLGEAQVLAGENPEVRMATLQHRNFLYPGPLWWAFDWNSAQHQFTEFSRRKQGRPEWDAEEPPPGVVLLIDEIDKADLDLPNGLLDFVDQQHDEIEQAIGRL